MLRLKTLSILTIAAMLAAAPAHAFFLQKKTKEVKEETKGVRMIKKYHLHIPDKKTEKELQGMLKSKTDLGDELKVLKRVLKQKQEYYVALKKQMKKKFGVPVDMRYQYDQESLIIYKLEPKGPDAKKAEKKRKKKGEEAVEVDLPFTRKIHKKLRNEERSGQFLAMHNGKAAAFQQIQALQGIVAEKEKELNRVAKVLSRKFNLSDEGMYNYDDKEMVLYEIVRSDQIGKKKPKNRKK